MLGLILSRQAGPYWLSALGPVSLNTVISRPCWIGPNSVAWMKATVLALFSGPHPKTSVEMLPNSNESLISLFFLRQALKYPKLVSNNGLELLTILPLLPEC